MDSNHQIKITDIDQICLERIFIHLNFEDLLNIADANEYLRAATNLPFNRKFASKRISIFNTRSERFYVFNLRSYVPWRKANIYVSYSRVVVRDLKKSFQLFRLFGRMIKVVGFIYFSGILCEKACMDYSRILYYVHEFCSESLVGINQLEIPSNIEMLNEIFPNVKYVKIDGTSGKKRYFSRNFPNVRFLYASNVYPCTDLISEHIQNLMHAELNLTQSRRIRSQEKALRTLIKANPQLTSLKLILECFGQIIMDACECMQSIESLYVSFDYAPETYYNYMRYQNVKRFILHYHGKKLVEMIPFIFDQLRELTLIGNSKCIFNLWSKFDNQNFLKNHPSIEKLTIKNIIVKHWPNPLFLPSLREYVFIPTIKPSTIKKALDYLTQFESMEKFSFECCDTEDTVRQHCENTWGVHQTLFENKVIYRLECITK